MLARSGLDTSIGHYLFILGLREIEWAIFWLKGRGKRGLQGDSAFRCLRFLPWILHGQSIEAPAAHLGHVLVRGVPRAADGARNFR
jgi:hypothetical protein